MSAHCCCCCCSHAPWCRQLQTELEKASAGRPSSGATVEDGKQAPRQAASTAVRTELPRRKLIIQEEDDEDDEEEERSSSVHAAQEERKELQLTPPQPQPATAADSIASQPMAVDSGSGSQPAGGQQASASPSIVSSLSSLSKPPKSTAPVPGAAPAAGVSAPSASLASPSPSPAPPASSPSPSSSSSSSVVRPPRSAMEFDSRYRGVRSQPAALSELLLHIPVAEYPTILRTALDASLLGNVLLAVSQHLMPSAAAELTQQRAVEREAFADASLRSVLCVTAVAVTSAACGTCCLRCRLSRASLSSSASSAPRTSRVSSSHSQQLQHSEPVAGCVRRAALTSPCCAAVVCSARVCFPAAARASSVGSRQRGDQADSGGVWSGAAVGDALRRWLLRQLLHTCKGR